MEFCYISNIVYFSSQVLFNIVVWNLLGLCSLNQMRKRCTNIVCNSPIQVVSHCESPDNAPFATGYVIVLVTAQVPLFHFASP